MKRRTFLFTSLAGLVTARARAASFRDEQRAAPRVKKAWPDAEKRLRARFIAAGVAWPPKRLLFRVFKAEDVFEVWASASAKGALSLVHAYAVTARSGGPGPKRRQGDGQVPEGFYRVSGFNPASNFHLSLRVSYPNKSDLLRKTAPDAGGDIMIHGEAVTIGCVPLGNEVIEEVYVAAVEAHAVSGAIEVQVYPARLGDDATYTRLIGAHPEHAEFWANLRTGLQRFETTKRPLFPRVAKDGAYVFE